MATSMNRALFKQPILDAAEVKGTTEFDTFLGGKYSEGPDSVLRALKAMNDLNEQAGNSGDILRAKMNSIKAKPGVTTVNGKFQNFKLFEQSNDAYRDKENFLYYEDAKMKIIPQYASLGSNGAQNPNGFFITVKNDNGTTTEKFFRKSTNTAYKSYNLPVQGDTSFWSASSAEGDEPEGDTTLPLRTAKQVKDTLQKEPLSALYFQMLEQLGVKDVPGSLAAYFLLAPQDLLLGAMHIKDALWQAYSERPYISAKPIPWEAQPLHNMSKVTEADRRSVSYAVISMRRRRANSLLLRTMRCTSKGVDRLRGKFE